MGVICCQQEDQPAVSGSLELDYLPKPIANEVSSNYLQILVENPIGKKPYKVSHTCED